MFDQERAAKLGLAVRDIANRVVANVRGELATRYTWRDKKIDVLVRSVDTRQSSVEEIRRLIVNPEVVRRNLAEHLPFMATETILMHAVSRGGDRQELHERIRQHSMAAAGRMKDEGADADLLERIAGDDAFGLAADELAEMVDPLRFVGRAPEQVARFLERDVEPALERQRGHALTLDDPELHV